jgi:hypothetical protein
METTTFINVQGYDFISHSVKFNFSVTVYFLVFTENSIRKCKLRFQVLTVASINHILLGYNTMNTVSNIRVMGKLTHGPDGGGSTHF